MSVNGARRKCWEGKRERRDSYEEGDAFTPQEETRRPEREQLLFQTKARIIGKSNEKPFEPSRK